MLNQGTAPGILGGIVKGFKGGKVGRTVDITAEPKSGFTNLEEKFLNHSFLNSSSTEKIKEEDMDLNIGSA